MESQAPPASPDDGTSEAPAVAPPVVAVVVTCDPGPWLEDALAALGDQDYPNFSVLVVDDASKDDPTTRVAAVLPSAYVRRLALRKGFGAACNEALELVEGASHYLFCHDDVAPDPDAVRLLVEEAFRSNAGIVAPKVVDWEAPERLLTVGLNVDKSGVPSALVERGELDQEQHDAVRDVFLAPGGCTLVRSDLFATLGGFDPEMSLYGEDLDLSWRAQVAGARVVVAPAARVRHLEAFTAGLRDASDGARPDPRRVRDRARPLQLRHRLRAVFKNYGMFHLIRVIPQLALLALAEAVYALITGRRRTAAAIVGAWGWNLRRLGALRTARRQVRKTRMMPDSEVRRLQVRGSARVNAFLRGQLAGEDRARLLAAAGRDIAGSVRDLRAPLAVLGVTALVLFVGSRSLLGGRMPVIGEIVPFPRSPATFLRLFVSGWRTTGLGSEGAAPAAFGLLGVAGVVLGGAMGVLQKLLVLGALPVGAIGAFRLARHTGSARARLVAAVVYLSVPLPYNALARGRLSGLIAYAAAPWILARLIRATEIDPFETERAHRWRVRDHAVPLGLLLAVTGAFVPAIPLLTLVVAAAVVGGSLLAGGVGPSLRALATAAVAVAIAAALLFPWTLEFILPGVSWATVTGVELPAARGLGLGALMRFETGPVGGAPIGWAFVIAAVLPLLVGGAWRLSWAVRAWTVALVCWSVALAGGHGWLPVPLPAAEVVLAPAAAALALAIALGLVAFEVDLPGFRFGWRQLASGAAAVGVVAGTLPVLAAAVDGRWEMPGNDIGRQLTWMPDQRARGAFRVLWLGDPEALPLQPWELDEGVGYGTSRGGAPDATVLWPGSDDGTTQLLADAVNIARRAETSRLGHLLAPMAVRYLVVPSGRTTGANASRPEVAGQLTVALDLQVDLRKLESEPGLAVYENTAWAPARARLSTAARDASRRSGLEAARTTEMTGSQPVLPRERSPFRYEGRVPGRSTVYLSEGSSSAWELEAGGQNAPRRKAFGWANAYEVRDGGRATLRYRTSPLRFVAIAVEAVVWAVAIRTMADIRRRRREGKGA